MFQPWSAVVITSKINKLKIFFNDTNITRMGFSNKSNNMGVFNFNAITQSDIFVIWCVDLNMIKNILENISSDNLNSTVTANEIASSKEGFDHSIYEIPAMWDAVIAAQTFCLAAESVGLGTMYCGAIKNIDLKKDLNLPDKVMPLFGICVGYPKENLNSVEQNTPVKPRLPQKLVVHNEKYSKKSFEEFMDYNNLISKFYQFYNMTDDWFTRIVQRSQLTNDSRLYKKLINKYGFWFR
jgi:nitroreductase